MKKSGNDEVSRRELFTWGSLGLAAAAALNACSDDTESGTDGTDTGQDTGADAGGDTGGGDTGGGDTGGGDTGGGDTGTDTRTDPDVMADTGGDTGTDTRTDPDVIEDTGSDTGTDTRTDPDVMADTGSDVGTDAAADTAPDVPDVTDHTKLGMVIDLHRCTGCGACIIACKSENNIQDGVLWANRTSTTTGTFPNVKYSFFPTLCNQCDNPPCMLANTSGSIYKGPGGITMIDAALSDASDEASAHSCPYKRITYNAGDTHAFWDNDQALIVGVTSAPDEVAGEVGGEVVPNYNPARECSPAGSGVANAGRIEKCTFCDHRVLNGKLPACVEACPSRARIFGDLNQPSSEVSQLLEEHDSWRDGEEFGTEPKVYYIRDYNAGS